MKKKVMSVAAVLAFALATSFAVAEKNTPEDRGKAHFDNPSFAGGKKACSTCHPNGRNLEQSGTKTKFSIMGGEQNSLEEAVNICIVNANKGTALAVDSVEMQELVSYIRSLGGQK